MTAAGKSGAVLTEIEHRVQLRRAVIASTIGTTIEWYDFFLYSTVTGLVFAKLYFPESDPLVGTLQAFAIYAVGFVARPIGAAIFGHYGDRIGRKAALIATLLLMGVATFLVAFVPTYAQIGIWGAIILTVLRFIQGVGVGGEWGGSVLLSMEWARFDHHRGFIAAWPQFGVPAGLFLANLAALVFSQIAGGSVPRLGMAYSVFLEHFARRHRPLHSPRHSRDAHLFAPGRREPRRENPGLGSDQTAAQGDFAYRAGAHGGASAVLHFHGFCFHLWDNDPRGLAQFASHRRAHRRGRLVLLNTLFGPSVGSDRAEAHVPAWGSSNWSVRICLFRAAQHTRAGLDFPCHRTVADPARYDVRPASGVDRRVLYRPVALQRRFYRLSAGFGLCGRARAADCNGTVCSVQIGLCHRGLRLRLRPHQLRRRRPLAGLHEPGHLPGIRRKVVLRALEARAGRPG